MNKIECKIQSNLFEDFPVGTIFCMAAISISKSIKMKFGMVSALRMKAILMLKLISIPYRTPFV